MGGVFGSAGGGELVHRRYRELLADWPVANAEQRMVPTGQGETFVLASGPPGAPPLVLLHGSAGTTLDWLGDIAAWSEHFRVYAIDIIGEPGLSAPSRPPVDSVAYATWLDDVLVALGIDRFAIVGVSIGGWFALDYAIRRPGRVERLALLTPSGIGRQKVAIYLAALALMPFGRWGIFQTIKVVAGPMPTEVTNPTGPTAELARRAGEFSILVYEHFRPRRVKLPVFTDDALAELRMHVTVGGRDRMLDSHETCRRLQQMPKATINLIPTAGHLLPSQTGPILEFLRSKQ